MHCSQPVLGTYTVGQLLLVLMMSQPVPWGSCSAPQTASYSYIARLKRNETRGYACSVEVATLLCPHAWQAAADECRSSTFTSCTVRGRLPQLDAAAGHVKLPPNFNLLAPIHNVIAWCHQGLPIIGRVVTANDLHCWHCWLLHCSRIQIIGATDWLRMHMPSQMPYPQQHTMLLTHLSWLSCKYSSRSAASQPDHM
jgi:hypothetical protein